MLTLSSYWLTFIIAVALPMIVGVVTQRIASAALKGNILLLLSVIAGWLTSLNAVPNHAFHWKPALVSIIVTYVTAYAAHAGYLKPNGVTGADGVIQTGRLSNWGIGGRRAKHAREKREFTGLPDSVIEQVDATPTFDAPAPQTPSRQRSTRSAAPRLATRPRQSGPNPHGPGDR